MADAQVTSAIANWGPRFTAQGVDPNDFARVTAGVERWEDWLGAWCANGDEHAELARRGGRTGGLRTAGEAWIRAAVSYHFGKFVWMLDMDRHYAAADSSVAAMTTGLSLLDPAARADRDPVRRRDHGGQPAPAAGRGPAAAGAADRRAGLDQGGVLRTSRTRLLARGLATFSLDGPGQGETGRVLKIRPDFEAPVAAVLDVLCARAPTWTVTGWACSGSAWAATTAARAAAFEPRIKAAVVCPAAVTTTGR